MDSVTNTPSNKHINYTPSDLDKCGLSLTSTLGSFDYLSETHLKSFERGQTLWLECLLSTAKVAFQIAIDSLLEKSSENELVLHLWKILQNEIQQAISIMSGQQTMKNNTLKDKVRTIPNVSQKISPNSMQAQTSDETPRRKSYCRKQLPRKYRFHRNLLVIKTPEYRIVKNAVMYYRTEKAIDQTLTLLLKLKQLTPTTKFLPTELIGRRSTTS